MDNLTPEERQVRLKKADSIRRMLAEQPSAGQTNKGMYYYFLNITFCCIAFSVFPEDGGESNVVKDEEKKQREHLLALNQVIARQVMEKSRMVAGIYRKPSQLVLMHVFLLFLFFIHNSNFRKEIPVETTYRALNF